MLFYYKKEITDIGYDEIFKSKPDIRKLFTNPLGFSYESHLGPIYSIDFSPYFKNYFLTGIY